MNNIVFFKFTTTSKHPTRGTYGSAGYDLYSDVDATVPPSSTLLVDTNVGVIIPQGYYGRIAPRSSLAYKYSIDVFAGVIDSDYRDKIGVILYNASKKDFTVKKGDRVAQIIFERCLSSYETVVFCTNIDEAKKLNEWNTDRIGGFGSTGK